MRTENDTLKAHVTNLSADRDHLSGELTSTIDKVSNLVAIFINIPNMFWFIDEDHVRSK
jgi:hypothetical protein